MEHPLKTCFFASRQTLFSLLGAKLLTCNPCGAERLISQDLSTCPMG